MAEATTAPKVKTSKPAASPFEMPKFEMPKFEIPKVEMPAAFREFAERGVAQCKGWAAGPRLGKVCCEPLQGRSAVRQRLHQLYKTVT